MSSNNDITTVREWYDQYMTAKSATLKATAPLIQAVAEDNLDSALLETRIESLRSGISVKNNHCNLCHSLFDAWPDLSDPSIDKHPDGTDCFPGSGADWKHTVVRTCDTLTLEAAARNGCRFCSLLVQMLKDAELLDNIRRIEARVELLGEPAEASLSLQNWGTNQPQLLWVNWPGKVCESCNGGSGPSQRLELGALPADGKIGCV